MKPEIEAKLRDLWQAPLEHDASAVHLPATKGFIDLRGQVFTRLTVVSYAGKSRNGASLWNCLCQCGKCSRVITNHLRKGRIKSCGCFKNENTGMRSTTHGHTRNGESSEHRSWRAMIERCLNRNARNFKNYGGRGISVCERWQGENGFANFLADMGEKPTSKHSIERIDNNKNYSPDNCRWATKKEQCRNQRKTRWIEYDGARISLAALAENLGMKYMTLFSRLKRGWSFQRAIDTPVEVSL